MICVFRNGEHGKCEGRLQWHHAIKQQRLKRGFPWGAWRGLAQTWQPIGRYDLTPRGGDIEMIPLADILGDARNRVWVCSHHHELVTNGRLHVELPQSVWEFADEYGLRAMLENDLARRAAVTPSKPVGHTPGGTTMDKKAAGGVEGPLSVEGAKAPVEEPRFCDWLMGVYASPDNPHRSGMYVRTIKRTGRVMNPGVWYELTDGKGDFWAFRREEVVRACGFCKGKPVGDAATWLDDVPRPPAPCPRCGKTYGPVKADAESSTAKTGPEGSHKPESVRGLSGDS